MGQEASKVQAADLTAEQQANYFNGTWYEQARSKNIFQTGCANSTAYYQENDGMVKVVNTCDRFGKVSDIIGVAGKINPEGNEASYWVKFPNAPKGEYNIVKVSEDPAADNALAIVTSKTWKYAWVLSRNPKPPKAQVCAFMAEFSNQFAMLNMIWNDSQPCLKRREAGKSSRGIVKRRRMLKH